MAQIYVPVLKGKEGEYSALEALYLDDKRKVLPLIEVPDIPYDWENERPSRSLGEHLRGVADRLRAAWSSLPIMLDFPCVRESNPVWIDLAPVHELLEECWRTDLHVIPIVARGNSPAYAGIVGAQVSQTGQGAGIRLFVKDFDDEVDLHSEIDGLLRAIGLAPDSVDLVIDLEELTGDVARTALIVRSLTSVIPHLLEWRRIILAASSFPVDLSDVTAQTIERLPRTEWQLWERIQLRPDRYLRTDVIFGDYGIAHPEPREMDPRMMRMSASIRYTTPAHWLIAKGRNVRQWGFDQYFELCASLVTQWEYTGEAFSWGDTYIAHCARRETGPGNATTWRKVGTNHHITQVVAQLSNPGGP